MVSDLNKLGIALKSLDAMKLGVGVNLGNVETYRVALKGLSVEQSVFALASKGATEEQIRQILVTNQATAEDVEAAMAKAGLTTATQALTQAEMVEMATKTGVAKATAEELLSKIGITATETGQIPVKKQVTRAMLEQAVASGTLTKAEASQIATMLGLNAVETANIGITNVLTASFAKLWAVITAHPIGAILTVIGAVAVGTIAYINKTAKEAEEAIVEAHENAKQALEDTKTSLSDDKSELQSVNSELETTKKRLKEISSIGAPTLTEQNELTKLSTANAQLEAQQKLLENNIKLKQKAAALDAKELLGTQVEMKYSSILDGSSITSATEAYSYDDHAKYQASNLKKAYNTYMKALRDGDVKKQQLAQELIDASAGDSAVLTSELLEIIGSFKYDDGTIIEGYEDLYNEYMGMIYNLQSLTNPDTFLEIAKSVTTGKGIDYEKAISEAYNLAYEGNFDVASLNQDFVKALVDAGIDESTISYIFKLKQQEYQLLVDKINSKYDSSKVQYTYWDGEGKIHHDYEKENSAKADVEKVNQELNEYARENPIEFQLVSSYDENFILLDKYIEEEKKKATNSADYVGDYVENAIQRIYDEAKVKSETFSDKITDSFTDAWSSLDTTEDENLKDFKKDVLELAEAGELTAKTFKETKGSDTFLEQVGLSAKDAVKQINSLVKSEKQLSALEKNISGLTENLTSKKEKPKKAIKSSVLDGMDEGFKKQTEEWDNYVKVLGNSKSTFKEVQDATNELATAYIYNNEHLSQLDESNKELYISQLKGMGITNAQAIVENKLTTTRQVEENKTKALALAEQDLIDMQKEGGTTAFEQSASLEGLAEMTNLAKVELMDLIAQQQIFNEDAGLSVDKQIDALGELALAYMGAAAKASFLNKVQGGFHANHRISAEEAWKQVLEEYSKINLNDVPTPTIKQPKDDKDKDSKSSKSNSKEVFDWIEVRLERLSSKTEKFKKKFEDAFTLKGINSSFKKTMAAIRKEIDFNEKAADKYRQKAENVDLSDKYKKKIRNGTLNIESITDEKLKKRIEKYQDFINKARSADEKAEELTKEKTELGYDYDDKLLNRKKIKQDEINAESQRLEGNISIKEAKGLSASKKDYEDRIALSKKSVKNLKSQNELLISQQEGLKKTSPRYQELQKEINSNNEAIQDAEKSQIEWNNAINNMKLDGLQKLSDLLDTIKSRFDKLKTLAELHGDNISNENIDKQFDLIDASNWINKGNRAEYLNSIQRLGNNAGFSEEQINQMLEFAQAGRVGDIETYVRLLGKEWSELGEFSEAINNYADTYNTEIDNAIEAEELNDIRWDNAIEKVNKYIEAIQKEKDIKDRILATEKAIFELEKAKANLTKKVWNGEQWVYTADKEAIQSAQEAFDNNKQEELINALEDLTEALEKEKEGTNLYDNNVNPLFTEGSLKDASHAIITKDGVVLQLVDSLPTMDGGVIDYNKIISNLGSMPSFMPQYSMPTIPSYDTVRNNSISIQNLEISMPNINDSSTAYDLANGLRNELSNLGMYAKQFDWNK